MGCYRNNCSRQEQKVYKQKHILFLDGNKTKTIQENGKYSDATLFYSSYERIERCVPKMAETMAYQHATQCQKTTNNKMKHI